MLTDDAGAELGQRIAESRSRKSWSLAEVSRRTGLSRAYINAIEHGRTRRPGADALRRLEDVLGPLLSGPSIPADVPDGLRRLAEERRIPTSEVQVLASLRIAGKTPVSAERWRFIYDAILASESLDAGAK